MTSRFNQATGQIEKEPEPLLRLELAIGRMERAVKEAFTDRTELQAKLAALPVPYVALGYPLNRDGGPVVPASGKLVLDLGAPVMGRRWIVRRLAICDATDPNAAAAGTANWYVGKPPATGTQPGGQAWRWNFSALPSVTGLAADVISVIPQDHLLCVINGATAGQSIVASAEVMDMPMVNLSVVQAV